MDVIDYRSKNNNITDENDCLINLDDLDLLTEHKQKGMYVVSFINFK